MNSFEEREKGFERKFELDQELAFKAKARRDKLFGLWAAERLGLAGDVAEAYAREVAAANFAKPSDADIVGKVAADLAKRGVTLDAIRLRDELERCAAEAKRQVASR